MRLSLLIASIFFSLSVEDIFANTTPVQGYVGKAGSGTSSNFSLSSNFGTQYKYIQLDIDPPVVVVPPSTGGGGGPSGPNTTNTRYKTQICQCDDGGNASCTNACVQDATTQSCIRGSGDKNTCLATWASTKGYDICSTANDCNCGNEPLLPSAPKLEPENTTEPEETPALPQEPENEIPEKEPVIQIVEEAPETEESEKIFQKEEPDIPSPFIAKEKLPPSLIEPSTEDLEEDKKPEVTYLEISSNSSEQSLFGNLYEDISTKLHFYQEEEIKEIEKEETLYEAAPIKVEDSCSYFWLGQFKSNTCIAWPWPVGSTILNIALFILYQRALLAKSPKKKNTKKK